MSEVLIDDKSLYLERFQCDCMDAAHALDITLDRLDGYPTFLSFNAAYIPSRDSQRDRLKNAWKIIRGKHLYSHDFIVPYHEMWKLISTLDKIKGEVDANRK